jgi:hypothetical protein
MSKDHPRVDVLIGVVLKRPGEDHYRLLAPVHASVMLGKTIRLYRSDHLVGYRQQVGTCVIGVLGRIGVEIDIPRLLRRASGQQQHAQNRCEQSGHLFLLFSGRCQKTGGIVRQSAR